jgi:hypothetical protein
MQNIIIYLRKLRAFSECQADKRLRAIGENNKVKLFRRKRIMIKLKTFFKEYKEEICIKMSNARYVRDLALKRKMFTLLKNCAKAISKKDNHLMKTFRVRNLKLKLFTLLKKFTIIKKRESYILQCIEQIYKKRVFRIKRNILNDWMRFFVCERFRKMRHLKLKIKLFYALKILIQGNY